MEEDKSHRKEHRDAMTQDQWEEESLRNIIRLKNHRDTMTQEQWKGYKLNSAKIHQKRHLTMSEEKREHVRAYDGEWHKIHRQDCNMED